MATTNTNFKVKNGLDAGGDISTNGSIRSGSFGSTVAGNALLLPGADTGAFVLNTQNAANKGLVIRGAASQTADLQQWQLSDGTVRAKIGPNGRMSLGSPATEFSSAFLSVSSVFATNPAIVARATTSQTANIQEWQNDAGTVKAKINSVGDLTAPSVNAVWSMAAYAGASTVVPLFVRGAASQTADLQQWQDSAATVKAKVNTYGEVIAAGISTTNLRTYLGEFNSGGSVRITKATAAYTPSATNILLQVLDGTNASSFRLVATDPSGATHTIIDNMNGTDTSTLGVKYIDGGSA